jgi:hypothetical protein
MRVRSVALALAVIGLALSIGVRAGSAPATGADTPASPTEQSDAADFNPNRFFTLRPDPRLCPSPTCGGYWVRRVNQSLTRCVDGKLQRECYVAGVRNAPAGGLGETGLLLLRGRIRASDGGEFPGFGVFQIARIWVAATAEPPRGRFAGLQSNDIVCVTTPCFTWDQYVLNRALTRSLSGLDFDEVGAEDADIARARAILQGGGVLLAAGTNVQVLEASGVGLHFVATQIYLPLP